MTLNDLLSGKTPIKNARFSTIVALSKTLGVSCEALWEEEPYQLKGDYTRFANGIRESIQNSNKLSFVKETIQNKLIQAELKHNKLFEARYLLCWLDYLCRVYQLPKAKEFHELRRIRFDERIFFDHPRTRKEKDLIASKSIPEFLDANIMEMGIPGLEG